MPANLTPQYFDAEERFKKASNPADKIAALEEMLRVIPKHKGTEKMQGDLKKRLAKLRKRTPAKSSGATHKPFYFVEREGIGQAVLCGPANSGKSQLLDQLTHAEPEVAPYPFTTRVPQTGMMDFEDVQIQLIDMPALAPETLEPWQTAMIAQADIAVVVFDVNDPELLDQTEFVLAQLEERKIQLNSTSGKPRVLILANKIDVEGGEENFTAWEELYEGGFSALRFCGKAAGDLMMLRRRIFDLLDVVRVYTKRPGQAPARDDAPFVLKRGATILDAATAVHKDLAEHLKFAKVWGHTRFEGQRVERTHEVVDGDIVEIHA